MELKAILAEVEGLADTDRIKRMLAIGRQARTEPETAAALKALELGGFYERRLALLACSGSRDGDYPLRMLSDPSRLLRGLALCLVPQLCTDAQVQEALELAGQPERLALLKRLIRRKRQGVVSSFIAGQAAASTAQIGRLLPLDVAETGRHLETVLPQYGLDDWQRLARLLPDTALDSLQPLAAALNTPDPRLRSQINAVLPTLVESRPQRMLALVETLLRHDSLSKITLQPLAKRLPNEVAALVLASEDRATVSFTALAHKLRLERLLPLVRRNPGLLGPPARWMRRLSPEARRAVYEVTGQGWRSAVGILDFGIASLLPGDIRAEEGRRHLALPALATRPAVRLPYAALLPWDEAQSTLAPIIRSPDAEMRAAALSALIGAARFDRTRMPEALRLVLAHAHEQDPVRRAMLTAAAALPPARWTAGDLEGLGQIIRDALSAADLSPATAGAAEKLVVALVPFHPEWAAGWLGTLVKERGQIHFYALGDRLSDRDVQRIAPALLPVLASWETRERETVLVQAARSLGRRLRVLPELTTMLERVLAVTPYSHTASQVLAVLSMYCPDRLATIVPALVQSDKSSVTLLVISNYLHRHRQDLLTPFLGQNAYMGRFSTGKTRFVLPLSSGFERWNPAQQELFAQTLDSVTRDTARDTPAILRMIEQLAALPAVVPARLFELARPAEKPAVRDAALRALARLDGGQGVPALVEALGDARARIAIYALRTVLLEMPPYAALALLQAVPMEKVTVAKEVVRLLGELQTPAAYPVLLALGTQDLHRDVRVALLRALWDHLEENQTWPQLDSAALNPDPAIASGVVRIPTDRVSPLARLRLVSLIGTLLDHPDAKIRLDVLARCVDLPLTDPDQVLLPRLLRRLGSRLPDEAAAAARAVFATYAGEQAGAVGEAVFEVRENRRALRCIGDALLATLVWQRGRQRPAVRAVLAALEGDPLTAALRADLAVSCLPWAEIASQMIRLASAGEMHAEVLWTALRALERTGSRLEAEGLARLEAALAAEPDERLRRLALASLAAQAGTSEGWIPALRLRLEEYCADPSPLVAAAAQFTFPPDDVPIGNASPVTFQM